MILSGWELRTKRVGLARGKLEICGCQALQEGLSSSGGGGSDKVVAPASRDTRT